jgi:hypothetical protein
MFPELHLKLQEKNLIDVPTIPINIISSSLSRFANVLSEQ